MNKEEWIKSLRNLSVDSFIELTKALDIVVKGSEPEKATTTDKPEQTQAIDSLQVLTDRRDAEHWRFTSQDHTICSQPGIPYGTSEYWQAVAEETKRTSPSREAYAALADKNAQLERKLRIDNAMIEKACRGLCAHNKWDPDEAATYSGTRKKVKNKDGNIVLQWELHKNEVHAILESVLK